MKNKILFQKINKLKFISLEESLRYEIYSIVTMLILSKDVFAKNIEIKNFANDIGLELKDYVIKSRTNILAKTLRYINTRNIEELKEISNFLVEFINSDIELKGDNYMNKILNKYAREENNE